jgi:hypothetical protein
VRFRIESLKTVYSVSNNSKKRVSELLISNSPPPGRTGNDREGEGDADRRLAPTKSED